MIEIGVQTWNVVDDKNPQSGFEMLHRAGFTCCDFSLNGYLRNVAIYQEKINNFFDSSIVELKNFFSSHKEAAKKAGIRINQMHMPYPLYVPTANNQVNSYLRDCVIPKSIELCHFFGCKYIVIHGMKLSQYVGSESIEWAETEKMIDTMAPLALQHGITLCVENLYNNVGGHLLEGPCCDVDKMVQRIDRINAKYQRELLGFCFDVGHANLIGLDFEHFITTLGKRLKVLHIHDNDGISDLHQIPYTFSKTRENFCATDWNGFVAGLRNVEFNGVLSFETAPVLSAFPNELKEKVLRFIYDIGIYFQEQL